MMLTDLLHNIFGAWGGSTHPSVAVAAVYAMSVGQMFTESGASDKEIADAYRYAFGDGLGWTHEETDQYWSSHKNDPYSMTDQSIDSFDTYIHWVRQHKPELDAATMRGDTWLPGGA